MSIHLDTLTAVIGTLKGWQERKGLLKILASVPRDTRSFETEAEWVSGSGFFLYLLLIGTKSLRPVIVSFQSYVYMIS